MKNNFFTSNTFIFLLGILVLFVYGETILGESISLFFISTSIFNWIVRLVIYEQNKYKT